MIKDPRGEIKAYYFSENHENYAFIDGSVVADLPMQRMSELFNINTFIVSQVNPHVAPFINADAHSHAKSRLSRKIIVKLRTVLGNEMHHWINQLTQKLRDQIE